MKSAKQWILILASMVLVLVLAMPTPAHAASFTAVQNGDWDNPATWGGGIPSPSDSVNIPFPIIVRVHKKISYRIRLLKALWEKWYSSIADKQYGVGY
jgi:hypothetical protein